MMRLLRVLFSAEVLLAMLLLAVCGGVFAGRAHWVLELLSHFVPQYALIALLLFAGCLFTGRYLIALLAFGLLCVLGCYLFPLLAKVPQGAEVATLTAEPVKILQFNVRYTDRDIHDRAKWVISQHADADVIILLEVTTEWTEALHELAKYYPFYMATTIRGYRGMVIFSRLPETTFDIRRVDGFESHYVIMHSRVPRRGDKIALFAIHPPPPVASDLAEERERTLAQVGREMGEETSRYRIMAGDFNLTRWSPLFRHLIEQSHLRDSFEGYGFLNTWPNWLPGVLRIAIDQALVSDSITVRDKVIGPDLGSDHLPVMTHLMLQ